MESNVDMSSVLDAINRRQSGAAPVPALDQTTAPVPTPTKTSTSTQASPTATGTKTPMSKEHSPEEARIVTKLLIKELNKLL